MNLRIMKSNRLRRVILFSIVLVLLFVVFKLAFGEYFPQTSVDIVIFSSLAIGIAGDNDGGVFDTVNRINIVKINHFTDAAQPVMQVKEPVFECKHLRQRVIAVLKLREYLGVGVDI
jgi:hypothetical protein